MSSEGQMTTNDDQCLAKPAQPANWLNHKNALQIMTLSKTANDTRRVNDNK
jgi:hypothetical protein